MADDKNRSLLLLIQKIQEFNPLLITDQISLIPRLLKRFEKEFHKNSQFKFTESNLKGHVFEVYVTNILIYFALNSELIDWIIPISNGNGVSRGGKNAINNYRRNRIAYGEIGRASCRERV